MSTVNNTGRRTSARQAAAGKDLGRRRDDDDFVTFPIVPVKKRKTATTTPTAPQPSPSLPTPASTTSAPALEVVDATRVDVEPMNIEHEMLALATVVETDAEEITRMKKMWKSAIYGFFSETPTLEWRVGTRPVPAGTTGARRVHVFTCVGAGCGQRIARTLGGGDATSTGNMHKHVQKCFPKEAYERACMSGSSVQAIRAKVTGLARETSIDTIFGRTGKGKESYSTRDLTKAEIRTALIRWVAESGRPFQVVEDPAFVYLMKTGRPDMWLPKAHTVGQDVRQAFADAQICVSNSLALLDGKFAFTTDTWTSPNGRAYMAVTVRMLHKDGPVSVLLDLREVAESHTGQALANTFVDVLKTYDVEDRVLSVTCNNASNNDVMVERMAAALPDFPGQQRRVRCLCHALNLSVGDFMAVFIVGGFKGEGGGNASDPVLATLTDEMDVVDEQDRMDSSDDEDDEDDALAMLSEDELADLKIKARPVRVMWAKLRKLAYKIKNSSTIHLPRWRELCRKWEMTERIMPRDVVTRWNAGYRMGAFAKKYKSVLNEMCDSRTGGLLELGLQPAEWEMLEQMLEVLKPFYEATLFFSSNAPTLSAVLPIFNELDRLLARAADPYNVDTTSASGRNVRALDNKNDNPPVYHEAIRAAAKLARRKLNIYYGRTDDSDVYRIAMVLNPRYKLSYFRRAGWPEEWVQEARRLTEAAFYDGYANADTAVDPTEPADSDEGANTPSSSFSSVLDASYDLDDDTLPTTKDELTRYLAARPVRLEPQQTIESWWGEHCAEYPRLSHMARDYYLIPAASVDVERVFSRGRFILPYTRNRLSAASTRAIICLGEWMQLNLLPPYVFPHAVAQSNITVVHNVNDEDGSDADPSAV